MKNLHLYIFALILFPFMAQAQKADFFSAVPDLPLMSGLEEQIDQTLIFDKPGGRIIELYATFEGLSRGKVIAYYESALPAFGWSKMGPLLYERDAERLLLRFDEAESKNILHIMISPR